MLFSSIIQSLKRGAFTLVQRKIYFCMMVVAPLLLTWFMLDLMHTGVVERVPVGIVDLDNSSLSRSITRNLSAFSSVDVKYHFRNYQEAADALQRGDIMGFFYMPAHLSEKALSGQNPKVSYYVNYAYFTPASNMFKGFKTISVLANGAIVSTAMQTIGVPAPQIDAALQPVLTDVHPINNPWLNYAFYLNASFVPCLLALLILLVTAYSIGMELKWGTSPQWLRTSDDSMLLALAGKLLPQTLLFTAVGWTIQLMMYRLYHYPLHCHPWHMMSAMFLFVLANQSWAVFAMTVVPNFRYGSTICTLFGMLSFSFCGFSLPQESLYPWTEVIGFLMPIKYYFLISIDQALNGIDLYYSRIYYLALLGFCLLPLPLIWRLKKECMHPVYVP